jgi:hypothetical protein
MTELMSYHIVDAKVKAIWQDQLLIDLCLNLKIVDKPLADLWGTYSNQG